MFEGFDGAGARCAVGSIPQGLGDLIATGGEEERVFVGHIVEMHAVFEPLNKCIWVQFRENG